MQIHKLDKYTQAQILFIDLYACLILATASFPENRKSVLLAKVAKAKQKNIK